MKRYTGADINQKIHHNLRGWKICRPYEQEMLGIREKYMKGYRKIGQEREAEIQATGYRPISTHIPAYDTMGDYLFRGSSGFVKGIFIMPLLMWPLLLVEWLHQICRRRSQSRNLQDHGIERIQLKHDKRVEALITRLEEAIEETNRAHRKCRKWIGKR